MSRLRTARRALVVAALVAVVGACGDDDDGTSADTPTATTDAAATNEAVATTDATSTTASERATTTTEAPTTTTVPTAPFERVVPGGDCQCADGSEFSFWVREADPAKVVLFFQGGGACFSAESCSFADGSYKVTTDASDDPSNGTGVWDLDDPRNPLAGYSIVFVPYCTGDVHLGDATTEYAPGLIVQHKGNVNATTALDHLVSTFPAARELVVTGESAGSIPSPFYAGLLSDRLPDASITVLADGSGAYPDVPGVNALLGGLWGVQNGAPDWPEYAGLTPEQWSFPGLFFRSGLHAPDIIFARHDYAFDETQVFFAALAGIPASDVVSLIDQNEQQIEGAGVDLLSYISPGDSHTVLSQPQFYTETVNGVPLVDWVTQLVNHEPVADVHCQECAVG